MTRILVLKFGGLGDVVQAFGPLARIRSAHADAELEVLTTPPFAPLLEASGLADKVWHDGRPSSPLAALRMLARLRARGYARVYDLQTSSRSSAYRLAFWPTAPEWSGIGASVSHPHRDPGRDLMHTLERQAGQLEDAGIWHDAPTAPGSAPAPDLAFLAQGGEAARFGLSAPYALLVPGASPHRPGKRWPAERYAGLARMLEAEGHEVAVVGGRGEVALGREIAASSPARDLTGATSLLDLAGLGAGSALVVGNDTGPVHLLAAAGAPTLVLFGPESDPALCAPRGRRVEVIRADPLNALSEESVAAAARRLIGAAGDPI